MFKLLRKPINLLLTGSISIIFAACYGTPVELQYSKTVRAEDDNSNPIEGLKVSLYENDTKIDIAHTDADGEVVFSDVLESEEKDYSIFVEDIDLDLNGSFEFQNVDIVSSENFYEVILNEK